MDEPIKSNAAPVPRDAREATDAQRREQEELANQDVDPDAPGSKQSRDQLPDESTR
jgi:hypothetical protein